MDLIAKLKAALRADEPSSPAGDRWAYDMVVAFDREAGATGLASPNLDQLPTAQAILQRPRTDRPELVSAVLLRLKEMRDEALSRGPTHYYREFWMPGLALNALMK